MMKYREHILWCNVENTFYDVIERTHSMKYTKHIWRWIRYHILYCNRHKTGPDRNTSAVYVLFCGDGNRECVLFVPSWVPTAPRLLYICMYICIHTHTYTYMCVCVYIHMYIIVYMYYYCLHIIIINIIHIYIYCCINDIYLSKYI